MRRQIKLYLQFFLVLLTVSSFAQAQSGKVKPTPTPMPVEDETEKIYTEEIKLNVIAFDDNGKFNPVLNKEDLVINEDNVLHQATSVRRIPANVLIVMDTGGDLRQMKGLQQTRETAAAIVGGLKDGDSVAVMQYSDKPEIVAEWTTDKAQILNAINKKTKFGRHDAFVGAITLATDFLLKNPLDNKHLVLITDGTDTTASGAEKTLVLRKLLATDINVHIVSYTKMEATDIEPRTKIISNTPPRSALPPEVAAQLPNGVRDIATAPKIGPTINVDRAMIKRARDRKKDLIESEKALSTLAENTNGEFILPETKDEMITKSALVAQIIDASYVVTYIPKKPLGEARKNEERNIEITSRRAGLQVEAHRKLLVKIGN